MRPRIQDTFVGRSVYSAVALLVVGSVLAQIFPDWEATHGLDVLMQFRGPTLPSDRIALVAVTPQDKTALFTGGIEEPSSTPEDWSRAPFGQIIDALSDGQAAVVAVNSFFKRCHADCQGGQSSPNAVPSALAPDDAVLRDAIARAAKRHTRVVLSAYFDSRERVGNVMSSGCPWFVGTGVTAAAPWTFPALGGYIREFFAFMPPDAAFPTLPTAAIDGLVCRESSPLLNQVGRKYGAPVANNSLGCAEGDRTAFDYLRNLFAQTVDDPAQRTQFIQDVIDEIDSLAIPKADPTSERQRTVLKSWVRLHDLIGAAGVFNHYGPARAIRTHSFGEVLDSSRAERRALFKDRIVFVGVSEELQVEADRGFFTVYSAAHERRLISGLELAATAAANLLDQTDIRYSARDVDFWIHLLFPVALGILISLRTLWWIPSVVGVGVGYAVLVYRALALENQLLPLFAPLIVEWPVALVWASSRWVRYRMQREYQDRVPLEHRALVPRINAANVAKLPPIEAITMAIDGRGFSMLVEQLNNSGEKSAAASLREQYKSYLRSHVRLQGGVRCDEAGDGMLAIWPSRDPDPLRKAQAATAALAMRAAIEAHNQSAKPNRLKLPTLRIGLHAGPAIAWSAYDSGAIQVVGDCVNKAARLEQLNKDLGTDIMLSEDALPPAEHWLCRPLGVHTLRGTSKPVAVYELLGRASDLDADRHRQLIRRFSEALAQFQEGQFTKARWSFEAILADFPGDGPCQYFLSLCDTDAG